MIEGAAPPRGIGWFLRALLPRLTRYRLASALLVLALMVDIAFEAMVPLSMKFLIDDAIVPQRFDLMVTILGALAGAGLLVAASQIGRDLLYAHLGSRVLYDLRQDLYAHLQRLSVGFYSRTGTADVMARFSTDLSAVESVIVLALPASIFCAISALVSVAILALLEWRLALLAFVGVPLCIAGPRLLGARAARAGYTMKSRQAQLAGMVQETVIAQPVVKAFGLRALLQSRFRASADDLRRTSLRANFLAYLMERTPNIGVLVFNLVVIGLGAWLAFTGEMSVGALVSFQALFLNLARSVEGFTGVMPHFVQGAAGLQRIEELLAESPQVTDRPGARTLPRLKESVTFDGVRFDYAGDRPGLAGLDLEIRAGDFIALVGASGSGKSTVLNLLMRFYDPAQGAVRFDGVDLRDASQDTLRAQIGVVFQESFLFSATIRENIRMGRPDASDEDVIEAARLAGLHEAVTAMPQGYETEVGERGALLSGGQRQRIAIARALLRAPSLLALDEATSALDPATESAINDTIRRLRAGRTVVSVTHRLASVVDADRIFVLRDGRLVEAGTHLTLLDRNGEYRALWEKQSGFSFSAEGDRVGISTARLRLLPVLSGLDDALLVELAQCFATELYSAGREVIQEGDPGDRFYLVARGRLEVLKTDGAGRADRVATLADGDHFGEIALLRDAPRNATVRTLTPATLLSLSRGQFTRLIARYPDIRARLAATVVERS